MISTEQLAINTIRTLAIESIEKAQSGHPGLPMGAAPMAYALWTKAMNHNPANPDWFNRDRFGASAPGGEVVEKYGFTPDKVAEAARQLIK